MRLIITAILLTATMLTAPCVAAADRAAPGRLVVAQSGGKSLNEAVEQVRRQCNGRIVSADTRVQGNREVHHIKCLTKDGKVKTHRINGKRRGNG